MEANGGAYDRHPPNAFDGLPSPARLDYYDAATVTANVPLPRALAAVVSNCNTAPLGDAP